MKLCDCLSKAQEEVEDGNLSSSCVPPGTGPYSLPLQPHHSRQVVLGCLLDLVAGPSLWEVGGPLHLLPS